MLTKNHEIQEKVIFKNSPYLFLNDIYLLQKLDKN